MTMLPCALPGPQVHAKIRANPMHTKKPRQKPAKPTRFNAPKMTYEQKKANLKLKLAALADDE